MTMNTNCEKRGKNTRWFSVRLALNTKIVFLIIMLTFLGPAAFGSESSGTEVPLFTSPDDFWIGATDHRDQAGRIPMYGATERKASWYIAAWNNPGGDLPPFRSHIGSSSSRIFDTKADAASVHLEKSVSGTTVTLWQNAERMPCQLPDGGPGEFDLLAGMNHPSVNPTVPDASLSRPRSYGLDQLSNIASLHEQVEVEQLLDDVPHRQNQCQVNQGNLMIGVVLRNVQARPKQILFYQLALRTICHFGATYEACLARRNRSGFWWTGDMIPGQPNVPTRRFGYRDTLATFGHKMLPDAGPVVFSVDLLPVLNRLLRSKQHGLDPDLSHWRIASAYFGQNIWGAVRLSSKWSNFELSVVPLAEAR
jgi:hypothetical protein